MYKKTLSIEKITEINTLSRQARTQQTKNKSCAILSCRTEGESLFFYKNQTFRVCRGDILFIPYNASYSQSTEKENVIYIHMDISGSCNDIVVYHATSEDEADEICETFAGVYDLWCKRQHNYYYHILSEIYRLVALKDAIPVFRQNEIPENLAIIINYIEKNFANYDFNFDNVCKAACICRTTFNKLFKNHFGITPHQYVAKLKTDKAKLLLESGFYTRTEIAHLCGFADVQYFYTFFKSHTGMSTSKYISAIGSKHKY